MKIVPSNKVFKAILNIIIISLLTVQWNLAAIGIYQGDKVVVLQLLLEDTLKILTAAAYTVW